jgi:hypothetical protein
VFQSTPVVSAELRIGGTYIVNKGKKLIRLPVIMILALLLLTLPASTALAQQSICDENPEGEFGGRGWVSTVMYAQTFVASSSYNVSSVGLLLKKNCTCTGTLTVSLRSTNGTHPNGELGSTTLDFAQIGCEPTWVEPVFPSPIGLTSGERYAIVLSVSTSYCVFWRFGEFDYPSYKYDTEWQPAEESYAFRIYGDCAQPPSPTPSPPPPVGGGAYPVNKLAILAPWLAIGIAILVASLIVVRRRRA